MMLVTYICAIGIIVLAIGWLTYSLVAGLSANLDVFDGLPAIPHIECPALALCY